MYRTVKHFATPQFWASYRTLPATIQKLADQCFDLLKQNPRHTSLHLKKVSRFWSVRVGLRHRALIRIENAGYGHVYGLDSTQSKVPVFRSQNPWPGFNTTLLILEPQLPRADFM